MRRAISTMTGQREQERLNAISLVNAGTGESAVGAAQAGLRNSFMRTRPAISSVRRPRTSDVVSS